MPNTTVPAAGGAMPAAIIGRFSGQTVFIGMTPTLRLRIETTIENLLGLLDEIDGDENLEPYHAGFDPRTMDDREEEDEHGGDINDEPQDGNELEADDGDYDCPGFIWGGNEDGR